MVTHGFPKVNKITAWSYSRLSGYQQCPLKAKLQYIDKLQEPKNPAMQRGNDIHVLAENYLKGDIKTMPPELNPKAFKKLFDSLIKLRKTEPGEIMIEGTWAFRKDWSQTVWNDWAGCWLRIKVDVAYSIEENVLEIIDWKTGKYRPQENQAYLEQLELYATAALLIHGKDCPDIRVRPKLVYLDLGITHDPGQDYTMADLPALLIQWDRRTKAMLNDETFAPKPNRFCGWCWFRAGNPDGPKLCKY